MNNTARTQYTSPDRLCHEMLPLAEVYSLKQVGEAWVAELRFDNLIHEGQGPSAEEAVLDAIVTIKRSVGPSLIKSFNIRAK